MSQRCENPMPRSCHSPRRDPCRRAVGARPHPYGVRTSAHVPLTALHKIVQGKRGITGDTVLRLDHWFQTSPQFWLNLQAGYDICVAETKVAEQIELYPEDLLSQKAIVSANIPITPITHPIPRNERGPLRNREPGRDGWKRRGRRAGSARSHARCKPRDREDPGGRVPAVPLRYGARS